MRVVLHLLAFFIPVAVLTYLATGPHSPWFAAFATAVVFVPIALDALSPAERRDPDHRVPPGVWNGVLWALTALHLAIVAALPFYVVRAHSAVDVLVAVWLVGNASAQGIVLGHELVHRPQPVYRLAGRALMAGVLYEHFYTEHVRGHHKRVGTAEDPATAAYGERFWPFFARTVPAQLRSAWALETKRLKAGGLVDRRHIHNRVLHGLIVGWGVAALVLVALGPLAFAAYVGQAFFAVLMLEGVNFMEHWGLVRSGKRVQVIDSWDSESGLTYYMLIGLARHGDHHAHAARPYQDLRLFAETPKMPWGYLATAYCAVFADFLLIPRLDAELKRCRLGPYRDEAQQAA
ncbi:MAG: fatty acid desaturase [Alphaproteobacteria bacterium]|nr:fatty acid desaturase [Alphaproteobacteria bacterium]